MSELVCCVMLKAILSEDRISSDGPGHYHGSDLTLETSES